MSVPPAAADIARLETLYGTGRYLDLHHALAAWSPPETWTDLQGRLIAGRAIWCLGDTPRALRLHRETWRRHPGHAEPLYCHLLGCLHRHGPFETLRVMHDHVPPPQPEVSPSRHEVFLWTLQARCLAQFRDFEAAQLWMDAAVRARPDEAWTQVERAGLLEQQDRYEEALAAARQALSLRPGYRPAIQSLAHLLTLVNREDEAVALLREALQSLQCGSTAQQLTTLLIEREAWADALEALACAARFLPLADRAQREWLEARRADLLYQLDRPTEAAAAAGKVRGGYYEAFAQRVGTGPRRRRRLDVGFVRQHHVTCAPATLSAVSRYWNRPIDHLALARVITYDGTPDHEERHWLEEHGWHVREFRATWETTTALIERGVPFTLVTTWVRQAHLQAVIGCDRTLGTLLIRDPYHRSHGEVLAAEFFQQQAPSGPRGMVLLPPEERGRLDGIELTDTALYDSWYLLRRALQRHDRPAAEEHALTLRTAAPGHRLALWARRELACYDDHPARLHEAVVALRQLFPDDNNLRLEELACLQRQGRRAEHVERLREAVRVRGEHPVFWRAYVEELRHDAREHARARRYARRLLRHQPRDSRNLQTFANLLWDERAYTPALEVYRLAATCGDTIESAWQSFFAASRHLGRVEEALALLQARTRRRGAVSSQPAQTLSHALGQLNRATEAQAVLDEALALRPADGDLRLAAAFAHGRAGRFTEAARALETARPHVARAAWVRTAALLAAWQADHAQALLRWREILDRNPLDSEALSETARLLAFTEDRAAALAWLAEQVRHTPHFLPVRQLRLEWLRSGPAEAALAEIRDYLTLHPGDAWAHREHALILERAGQPDAALAVALLAETIDPHAPSSPGIVGKLLVGLHRLPEAREATERALRLSIDAEWLMPQLLAACPTFAERRAAVAFLRAELTRQHSLGNAFLRFHAVAAGIVPPDELRALLAELHTAHPEHWETGSALIQQALAQKDHEAALALATEATRRFPLLPRVWLDLADVQRERAAPEAETAAVQHALELSPGWSLASQRLATLEERSARIGAAEQVLRKALVHDPLDVALHTNLAQIVWNQGGAEEAMRLAEHAIALAPAYAPAWQQLRTWSQHTGTPARVLALARHRDPPPRQRRRAPAPRPHLRRE